MKYVDGYVIVVPKKNLLAYQKMAKKAAKIWLEYGAIEVRESAGDDLNTSMGIPFTKLAQAKKGETVVFSWIVYKTKAQRDRVNAKVMKDERIQKICDPKNPPFDMKRFSYGGFKTLVDEVS